MRILITGASGYIGKHVVKNLQKDYKLYLTSRTDSTEFVFWDMAKPANFEHFPKEIDVVLHLAQSQQYRDLVKGADDMFNVNVASAFALIRYAVEAGAKYFCYISTGSVYETSGQPLKEDMIALNPKMLLGASKHAAELLLHPFSDLIKIGILRLFMPYGPLQMDRLLPNLIQRVKNKQPITLTAEGTGSVFATTYIDDVITIIRNALENYWTGTMNVASRSNISIQEMGELIGKQLDISPIFQRDINSKLVYFVPDLSKLASLYPVDNMLNFEQGLEKTLRFDIF